MTTVASRYQAPNFRVTPQQSMEEILYSLANLPVKAPVTLASGFPRVKEGDLLGKITASGKYRRYTRVAAKNAEATGSVLVELKEATLGVDIESPFKVGELITIGATAAGAISAVSNTNKTVSIAALGGAGEAASAVIKLTTAEGSEATVGIAAHPAFSALYDPSLPDVNFLLDVDYTTDLMLQAVLRRTKTRGLDSQALTDLVASSVISLDAIFIR